MSKYWFVPKRFGYGFVPVSVEGWIATIILLSLVFLSGVSNGVIVLQDSPEAYQNMDVAGFVFELIVAISIFTLTMRDKTKGTVKWRWGR